LIKGPLPYWGQNRGLKFFHKQGPNRDSRRLRHFQQAELSHRFGAHIFGQQGGTTFAICEGLKGALLQAPSLKGGENSWDALHQVGPPRKVDVYLGRQTSLLSFRRRTSLAGLAGQQDHFIRRPSFGEKTLSHKAGSTVTTSGGGTFSLDKIFSRRGLLRTFPPRYFAGTLVDGGG